MALVIGTFVLGVILAIAAVLVFREALRMQDAAPSAVVDPDDAYEFVAAHLDDLVASTLTPDDLRRILDLQLEHFKRAGVASNGSSATPPGPAIVGGVETVDYILERAAATGEPYLPEQVHAVVETHLAYLRAIGAVGRAVPPGAGPDSASDPGPAR
jgi:hypothetical protein